MGWPDEPRFYVPEDALDHWREAVPRGAALEADWRARLGRYAADDPEAARELGHWLDGRAPRGLGPRAPRAHAGRRAAGHAAGVRPRAPGDRGRRSQPGRRLRRPRRQHRHHAQAGRNVRADARPAATFHWGVREHGMAACLNGIAAHGGLRGVRQHLPGLLRLHEAGHPPGRDHAAAGHLHRHPRFDRSRRGRPDAPADRAPRDAARHSQPRDAASGGRHRDGRGVARGRWRGPTGPTMLVLTRQKLPVLDRTALAPAQGVARGAYVLLDPPGGTPQAILIATGSEVHVALARGQAAPGRPGAGAGRLDAVVGAVRRAARRLSRTRCCRPACACGSASRPRPRSGGSAGSATEGAMLAMDGFGASAPGDRLFQEFKFTPERAAAIVRQLLAHGTPGTQRGYRMTQQSAGPPGRAGPEPVVRLHHPRPGRRRASSPGSSPRTGSGG